MQRRTKNRYPEPGKATVRVLEAVGVHVRIPDDRAPSGRATYTLGKLDLAAEHAERNRAVLGECVDDGWDIVAVEPSDVVVSQDEYCDLLPGEGTDCLSANAYSVMEYLGTHRLVDTLPERDVLATPNESVAYHGRGHQKSIGKDHHAVGVLRRVGCEIDPLDSGCCGMAGSFGYEAEHYDLSKAIARDLSRKIDDSTVETVVVPGGSRRRQIGDRDAAAVQLPHPVEKVDNAHQE